MGKRWKMPAKRSVSANGVNLVAGFEGFSAHAYKPVAAERYLTIGYGHYGPDVHSSDTVTRAEARKLLRQDLSEAEDAVRSQVKVRLTQGQYDALVSFTFNVGAGNLASSTLLKKLNKGRYRRARWQLHRWVLGANHLPLLGLVRRRRAEAKLWRS